MSIHAEAYKALKIISEYCVRRECEDCIFRPNNPTLTTQCMMQRETSPANIPVSEFLDMKERIEELEPGDDCNYIEDPKMKADAVLKGNNFRAVCKCGASYSGALDREPLTEEQTRRALERLKQIKEER